MTDPITRLNTALEGRYAIERELGEGRMANVYLAEDLKHHRKVALKVLRPELAAVLGAERFVKEIETTANLQHPHILPLFDSVQLRSGHHQGGVMRITIVGATGSVGRRVVAEALSRGHEVTAVVRDSARYEELPEGINPQTGDASNADDMARLSEGQDVVISAIRPALGRESEIVPITQALLDGLAQTGVRLLVVGGAACLTVPNSGGTAVIDDPRFVPEKWHEIAQTSLAQYQTVRAESRVDWAYLCPPAMLEPGERTGRFRLGDDELILDADGNSTISIEDLSVVLLDEAERPQHHQTMFTAAY